jgi:hypothetical protein
MIKKVFRKSDAEQSIEYPTAAEWKVRHVTWTGSGVSCPQTIPRPDNATARLYAHGLISKWIAEGWSEVVAGSPAKPQIVQAAQNLLQAMPEALEVVALSIASTLAPTPDWNAVWERIGEQVANKTVRRRVLQLVQQKHAEMQRMAVPVAGRQAVRKPKPAAVAEPAAAGEASATAPAGRKIVFGE